MGGVVVVFVVARMDEIHKDSCESTAALLLTGGPRQKHASAQMATPCTEKCVP